MAVTYKDISLLTQKASVAGTEKIPVSGTEYITPTQITQVIKTTLDKLLVYEDLSGLTVYKKQINSSGSWVSYTSSDPDCCVVLPITAGEQYCVINLQPSANAHIAILTSTTPGSGAASFATGYTSRIAVAPNTPFFFTAPSDAAGMYVLLTNHSGISEEPEVYHVTGLSQYVKYKLLQDESEMPASPDSGTLYLIPETS